MTTLGTSIGREPLRTRGAEAGDWVLVTKGIAIEGTAILARHGRETSLRLIYLPTSNGFTTFHWNDLVRRNDYWSVSTRTRPHYTN